MMVPHEETLNLPLLGLQLDVVYATAESCLVPWVELELGVCSLRVRLQQYWPCLIDR